MQIELINIFSENNIPLTVGIIADDFGNDPVIVDYIKNELNKVGTYKILINLHSEVSSNITIKIDKIQSMTS